MRTVQFTRRAPGWDRRHFVDEDDVRVVLARLPAELSRRLRAVHFNDRARGNRVLGYVNRARREIALCALPPRVSLGPFLRRRYAPSEFGAARGCQWPALAVRRFMLYDVFLHELGHLQVVRPRARAPRRKFAREVLAQRFADHWRRRLWSEPFDHPDPVHNPPAASERDLAAHQWPGAHAAYKRGLHLDRSCRSAPVPLRREPEAAAARHFIAALTQHPGHPMALERLGAWSWAGVGVEPSVGRAVRLLSDAVRADPRSPDAWLYLAIVLGEAGPDRREAARAAFARAVAADPFPPVALVQYAVALGKWGCFAEAERLFQRALRAKPDASWVLTDYARLLLHADGSAGPADVARAGRMCERAVALDPTDARRHYWLAVALSRLPEQHERALNHVRRAIELDPGRRDAEELQSELTGLPCS